MSPTDARVAKLSAEIVRDWAEVERQAQRASEQDPAVSGPNAAWVALALDHAYEAFESLLRRLEIALGLPARSGERWHLTLLEDAAMDIPGLRPPIVPANAARHWMELLEFRHFLRHAYAVDLDPDRLAANVRRLREAVGLTRSHVQRLADTLTTSG